MPRAPQSRALLAGRPAAKRSVLASRMSRTRSMPTRSCQRHPGDLGDRAQLLRLRLPDEGVGGAEVDLRQDRRRQALDRGHETEKQPGQVGWHRDSKGRPGSADARQARGSRAADQPAASSARASPCATSASSQLRNAAIFGCSAVASGQTR